MAWQTDEDFYLSLLRAACEGSLAKLLDLDREAEISFFFGLSPIQDAFAFRARYIGLKAANLLIDERGGLRADRLELLLQALPQGLFSLGPNREGDSLIFSHVLHCLERIREKEVWDAFRKFSPPLCHAKAAQIVRSTLWPEEIRSPQTHHIRRAVLAAWLTPLRQGMGSCFATAPAILIQKRGELFFKDLYELLSTGQIRRVIGGRQYAVPLSPSIGSGDLDLPIRNVEHLWFSPGLIAGLSAAGFFSARESMQRKAARLQSALGELKTISTARQVLRDLTLRGVGLTEEELEEEERLGRTQVEALVAKEGAVFYQRPSLGAQKAADWKQRFQSACLAFQSLTECAALRAWEYSIASFCDVKTDFAKWNLYTGLGLDVKTPGGAADCLYRILDRRLQEANEQMLRFQRIHEQAVHAVQSLEALFPSNGGRIYELHGEMAGSVHDARMALEERDKWRAKAEAIAGFFAVVMQYCDAKLQESFQEVFDPSAVEEDKKLSEDRPAGFRLLYKHGRSNAANWTLIYDGEEYIRSLRSFFTELEREIEPPAALGRAFVSDMMTQWIQGIQEPEFLRLAQERSQSIGRKTPWEYVSGGTMQSLVQAYYGRSQSVSEQSFLPGSAMELLRCASKWPRERDLLFHSPTHAFLLRLDLFPEHAEACMEENRQYAKKMLWEEEIEAQAGRSLSERLPPAEQALFFHLLAKKPAGGRPAEFREALVDVLLQMRYAERASLLVDAHLYEQSFLLPARAAEEALRLILRSFPALDPHKTEVALSRMELSFAGASALHRMAKAILCEALESPLEPLDWDEKIGSAMRRLGFAPPHLILFADTNWQGWFFGFVANPFTGKTELWRLNRIGTKGAPMSDWKTWLSPANRTPWVLLSRPEEYNG